MTENKAHTGKVILASAGPGDPELITAKAIRCLMEADVVLVDRLVSDVILEKYVSKKAEIIYVGKQHKCTSSTKQDDINQLLVSCFNQGKKVVRLKGGDASIFSNVLDELQALAENDIPYEIIPGVTAASGAAVYAGFPLTARGYAASVKLLTCYNSDTADDEYWKDLATTEDTLIFYMSREKLDIIVDKLVKAEISNDKLLAVVEQATTPFQNVYITDLYEYDKTLKGKKFLSPTIIIIGKVVALHKKFGWKENHNGDQYYFKPIS